jgi:ankyrin repeat protein
MERFYDISQRSTQLECIKLAVNLISNNHDTWRTLPVIVELAKDKSNLLILKGLFKQKLLILDAVAEKLLYAAAEYRNLPLLRTLVDIGWNIDSVEDDLGYRALSCAVRNGDEDMVMFLLDRGAKTINYYWVFQKGVYESILDLAVERGKINMIKDILTPRPNCRSDCPNITTHTLYLAVILGDINIMNLLVDRNPSLLDNINSKPWLLSEAAAIHGTVSILTHLQSWNIDIAATNASGKGSALAVACYRANMPLIYLLIDSGADVDGVVLGFCQHDEFPGVFPLEEKLNADITAKSALHIAVEMDHKDLVQFLLDRGADPNQCCCAFPLQLATVNGNNTVVKMLLAAGANLDSVHDINKGNYRYSGTFWGPSFEKPAVQLALERGFESIFFTLVEGGAEIPCGHSEAAVRDAKWNPLQSALIGKNKHLVHFILKRAGYSLRGTRVCLARCLVQFGFVLTKTLIDHGIFAAKALHDPIVLCNSVEKGDIELVQSLVLDTKLSLGELPPGYGAVGLALAVRLQKENIVKFFLDVGVKPYDFADLNMQRVRDHDSRDDWQFGWKFELLNGTNALQEAFRLPNDNSRLKRSRNLCCPKILLDECGEVLKDMKQITQNRGILSAYGEAIATGRTDMVNIILDTRLDVRAIDETIGFGGRDEPRRSSLQRLLFSSSFQRYGLDGSRQTYEVAKTLLEHGAVPDCLAQGIHRRYDAGIQTPLQYAAQISGTSLVTKLLAMGADVNAKPNIYKGATALQYAAINGNFEILNILLEAGANINALPASCEGRSAIEGASEWGRLDMVTYLLEAGANVQGRANKNYRRSVYRAWKAGYRYLASKIQEWKTERFGADDCEAIDTIMESMTEDELNFVDLDAKARLKELYPKKFHR